MEDSFWWFRMALRGIRRGTAALPEALIGRFVSKNGGAMGGALASFAGGRGLSSFCIPTIDHFMLSSKHFCK
jgi:hypothetical protein